MAVKDAEHQLNLEISENESRKDFSKAERIDYARRLERIESLKAKGRMSDGEKGCRISDNLLYSYLQIDSKISNVEADITNDKIILRPNGRRVYSTST